MFRPGLALYGYVDRIIRDGLSLPEEPDFVPALTWKTQVTSLRSLQKGDTSGYGNTFVAAGLHFGQNHRGGPESHGLETYRSRGGVTNGRL